MTTYLLYKLNNETRGSVTKVLNVASRLALQEVSAAIEGRKYPYFLLPKIPVFKRFAQKACFFGF